MSITLDGTAGITNDATDLNYTGTLTGGTGVVNLGSGQFYKDASGNVGIGTSSPTTKLHLDGGAASTYMRVANTAATNGLYVGVDSSGESLISAVDAKPIKFLTSNTERMRIDASGNLLTGGVAALPRLNNGQLSVNGLISARASAIPSGAMDGNLAFGGSTGTPVAGRVYFGDGTGWQWNWGPVLSNGTFSTRYIFNDAGAGYNLSGTWGSISDARLKENVTDATPKLNDLLNLRVRNFNFIAEPSKKQIGFIAQEVEEVFPGLVDTPKPDENGNAMKAVKISVLVPMLVKAIQELNAINDAQAQTITAQQAALESLTARVAALEGQA